MDIMGYAKSHPVATGIIAVVGVVIFVMIVSGGGGSAQATGPSGPSDAEIMANAQIAAAQINASSTTSAASIGAGVQMNSDNKAAEVAMAQVGMYNSQIAASRDVELAGISAQSEAIKYGFDAQNKQAELNNQRTQSLVGALGGLKKKNRDEALQSIATGQVVIPGHNPGNSASAIIGSIGSALGSVGSLATIFSDQRLKENIRFVGYDKAGREVYQFNYKGSKKTRQGYIAQSLARTDPELINYDDPTGYFRIRLPGNV